MAKNLSINKGQSTVIKVSNGNNYSWSGNAIQINWGDSIEIKPTVTFTYQVIGINEKGAAQILLK